MRIAATAKNARRILGAVKEIYGGRLLRADGDMFDVFARKVTAVLAKRMEDERDERKKRKKRYALTVWNAAVTRRETKKLQAEAEREAYDVILPLASHEWRKTKAALDVLNVTRRAGAYPQKEIGRAWSLFVDHERRMACFVNDIHRFIQEFDRYAQQKGDCNG